LDSHAAPIEVVLDNVGVFSQTFIFYDCIGTDKLRMLHEDLVQRLRRHVAKEEPGPGLRQGLTKLTKREVDYMIKYGYPFVRESFRPHFTIGRVVGEVPDIDEVRGILRNQIRELRNYRFLAKQIIAYEVGTDGRCARILTKRDAR
jgi:2'-5' RNA ligase